MLENEKLSIYLLLMDTVLSVRLVWLMLKNLEVYICAGNQL